MLNDFVIVMAKEPAPGAAKTRLAAIVGMDAASRLAGAFLLDTVALVQSLPACTMLLSYTPPGARPQFERLAGRVGVVHEQPNTGFGGRLEAGFAGAFELGAERAVVIATDSPSLPRSYIAGAFEALHKNSAVIGPADDGGYYLLGLRRLQPHRFHVFEGIDWSTERVFAQTMERAWEIGVQPHVLPQWYDVDDAEGLQRLRADLLRSPESCAHTRSVLATLATPEAAAVAG